jgi:hypothetical protein
VCNSFGEVEDGGHIYYLCLEENCNKEFNNSKAQLEKRNTHDCGIVKAEAKNKKWMHLPPPPDQYSTDQPLSIEASFTSVSAARKKAPLIVYGDEWGFNTFMQPICRLVASGAISFSTVHRPEFKIFMLGLAGCQGEQGRVPVAIERQMNKVHRHSVSENVRNIGKIENEQDFLAFLDLPMLLWMVSKYIEGTSLP